MKKSIIFLFLLLPFFVFAQIDKYIEDDPQPTIKKHRGLAYSLLETGSGLGLFIEYPTLNYFHFGLSFDAFMLRDRSQVDLIDPFTGYPISYGRQNNVYMFDLLFSVKKRLLAEEFDDSFRPFVTASAGPVFGMNFPEESGAKDQYRWTLGGILGAGVDADVDGRFFFAVRAQYRILPFFETIGPKKDHSMFDIRLELGQRF